MLSMHASCIVSSLVEKTLSIIFSMNNLDPPFGYSPTTELFEMLWIHKLFLIYLFNPYRWGTRDCMKQRWLLMFLEKCMNYDIFLPFLINYFNSHPNNFVTDLCCSGQESCCSKININSILL